MRVARTDSIVGIPAPLARELMRAYWQERPAGDIRYWVPRQAHEVVPTITGAQVTAADSMRPVAVLLTRPILGE